MKAELGELGLKKTWQKEFPKETECCRCGGTARIGFVAHEIDEEGPYVYQIHDNEPKGDGFWPHDCCAVAIYLCKKCMRPTALFNQA